MINEYIRQRDEYLDACAVAAMAALVSAGFSPKSWTGAASWEEALAADAYDIARAMYNESMKVLNHES